MQFDQVTLDWNQKVTCLTFIENLFEKCHTVVICETKVVQQTDCDSKS